jgi:hypothetical protein
MAHQINLIRMPQLADAGGLEADQNGGYTCGCSAQVNHAW